MLTTACSLALLLLGNAPAQAAMYRWVDGAGRVHYGDTLPPSYQQSGAAELNKQGLVVKHTASESERRDAASKKTEADKRQRAVDEQARLDHALTATYTTEAEIDLARDRALEHHKLVIKGADIRAKVVDATLKDLYARADKITRAKRPLPSNLKQQLAQSEQESLELKQTVLKNQEALVSVRAKYDADKQRFKELITKTP